MRIPVIDLHPPSEAPYGHGLMVLLQDESTLRFAYREKCHWMCMMQPTPEDKIVGWCHMLNFRVNGEILFEAEEIPAYKFEVSYCD